MRCLSIKRFTWWWLLWVAILSSCSMMKENRDDCPVGLYLSFKYDYNLERADMFNDHVGAVDVYVFDQDGKYITTLSDANMGEIRPLADPTYMLHADLQPGKYKFIVLGGQAPYKDLLESARAHFVRSELHRGDEMTALEIKLDTRKGEDNILLVDNQGLALDTLWHGMELEPVEVFAEKPTYHTISLIRDTKKINVTLRELDDPTSMDIDNYDLTITDRNTHLLWDNSVNEKDTVVYTPHATWNTTDRIPGSSTYSDEPEGIGKIAHADFMTSRIIYHDDAADDAVLSVVNKNTGVEVIRVNLADMLSRLRTSEDRFRYSEQEFLDRGYDYQLHFYLKGDRLAYVNICISVLSWNVHVQFEDL